MTNILNAKLSILVLTGLLSVIFTGSAMAIEEPKYRVIEHAGNFELRVYDHKNNC